MEDASDPIKPELLPPEPLPALVGGGLTSRSLPRHVALRANPDQDSSSAAKFTWAALRRWWMIATPLGLLFAALGAAAVYLLFQPMYEAAAWFRIDERPPYIAFESKTDEQFKLFMQTQRE